jgi:MOSC domain-containing protein YiiM
MTRHPGTIAAIAYNPEKGLPRPLHAAAELVADHGIVGDHRAGSRADRALNLLDERHIEALAAAGYDVRPGSLGENIVIRGLDLDQLPSGSRLRLGESAVARIVSARHGCANLKYIHTAFPEAAAGRIGYMCAVEQGGEVRVGDEVAVLGDDEAIV